MNEGQRKRIAIEMEHAVAFPPMYEIERGAIEVLVPISFAGRSGRSFPYDLEFELVRIDADGKVVSRHTALYQVMP